MTSKEIIKILNSGGIGVLPTDTLYGLVGRAVDKKAVRRIYEVKGRPKDKKFITLISSLKDLQKLGIVLNAKQKKIVSRFWTGPVSIVLAGTAIRFPKHTLLQKIIAKTGPLVAPSANPSGLSPAETICEAKIYFGDAVDFYVSAGRLRGLPSTLISLVNGIKVLRQGRVKI